MVVVMMKVWGRTWPVLVSLAFIEDGRVACCQGFHLAIMAFLRAGLGYGFQATAGATADSSTSDSWVQDEE